MAAITDMKRRIGVGWGGIALYLALFLAGAGSVEWLGDLPSGGPGSRPPPTLAVTGLVFGVGLVGLVVAASNLPTYARLSRTGGRDTGAVADGASGDVVLTGTAETAGGTVETPFGGTPALAYTTRVLSNAHDDAETARDSEKNWRAVHVGEDATTLAVDDGSGPATVDPAGARMHLSDRERQFVTADRDLPVAIREHLRDVGVDVDDGAHLRFEEKALVPGEEAFVLGSADGGTVDADLLAEGDHEKRIRIRVKLGAALGCVVTLVGYLGVLLVSGVF